MARPQKTIDWEQMDKLCALQCTGEEIAAYFEIDYDTLNAICKREREVGFSDYFAQKRKLGYVSLRRQQMQACMDGNPSMLIWLGKNWLGQSDQIALEANVQIKGFRVVEDDLGNDGQPAAS